MQLLDSPPCALLADFVESYWYVEAAPRESSLRPDAILPNGTSNLIFNLSGFPHREYTSTSCQRFQTLNTRWLSGIRDRPVVVGPTNCTKVVGVRFKPAGLLPFLNAPPAEIAGMTIDADALWGQECRRLHERLFESASVKDQFALLEGWLLARFDPRGSHAGLLRSMNQLQAMSGGAPIGQLARLADLSLRQYRRRFEQAVGMPPKRLARVLRFGNLIQQIGTEFEPAHWARIAFDCSYYDQAHLIADFREFAGVTPGEYLRRRPAAAGFLPVDAPMSLFSNTAEKRPVRLRAS